jgi:putative redox protein
VLQAAARLESVRAVVTIAAPFSPQHVTHLFGDREREIRERGEATVTLAGRSFRIRREFLEDLASPRMEETIRGLKRALLVMHSPVDNLVGVENAAQIFQAAKHPKSFVSLDDADHLLTDAADARYAARVLAAWASRYVPRPAARTRGDLKLGSRVVARNAGGFETEIMAGGHPLVADEPESVGGTDRGPTPYDLLGSALAACTAMTVRMYAGRKGWPLDRIEVGVSHQRIHADDEERCEDAPAKLDQFDRDLLLEGDLDESQRARLLEISGKCPVHKTLAAGVRIETELVED